MHVCKCGDGPAAEIDEIYDRDEEQADVVGWLQIRDQRTRGGVVHSTEENGEVHREKLPFDAADVGAREYYGTLGWLVRSAGSGLLFITIYALLGFRGGFKARELNGCRSGGGDRCCAGRHCVRLLWLLDAALDMLGIYIAAIPCETDDTLHGGDLGSLGISYLWRGWGKVT
jgi:hypothetical protein